MAKHETGHIIYHRWERKKRNSIKK